MSLSKEFPRYTGEHTLSLIKNRPEDSHKGLFGTLVSLCGCPDMTGAAFLSSMAALRSGVGLLAVASDPYVQTVLKSSLYEAVYINIDDIFKKQASAYLIGCGIGRQYDNILESIFTKAEKPTVIDADGINYLAANINVLKKMCQPKIITPHPTEMGRLIGKDASFVQSDRTHIATEFASEYNCVVVLKGKNTVIAFPSGESVINTTGNSGLSKGGSGDVLAGVIASLCAQGYSCEEAAVLGVYVHGLAADRLTSKYGKHGLLPRDLPEEIGLILG